MKASLYTRLMCQETNVRLTLRGTHVRRPLLQGCASMSHVGSPVLYVPEVGGTSS
jgi:hypothetical protein